MIWVAVLLLISFYILSDIDFIAIGRDLWKCKTCCLPRGWVSTTTTCYSSPQESNSLLNLHCDLQHPTVLGTIKFPFVPLPMTPGSHERPWETFRMAADKSSFNPKLGSMVASGCSPPCLCLAYVAGGHTCADCVLWALKWKQETKGQTKEAILFSSSLCLGQRLLSAVVLASTRWPHSPASRNSLVSWSSWVVECRAGLPAFGYLRLPHCLQLHLSFPLTCGTHFLCFEYSWWLVYLIKLWLIHISATFRMIILTYPSPREDRKETKGRKEGRREGRTLRIFLLLLNTWTYPLALFFLKTIGWQVYEKHPHRSETYTKKLVGWEWNGEECKNHAEKNPGEPRLLCKWDAYGFQLDSGPIFPSSFCFPSHYPHTSPNSSLPLWLFKINFWE